MTPDLNFRKKLLPFLDRHYLDTHLAKLSWFEVIPANDSYSHFSAAYSFKKNRFRAGSENFASSLVTNYDCLPFWDICDTVISIKFLLVISMLIQPLRSWELRIWSRSKVNFLDILITSPKYFYKKSMGTRQENLFFDILGVKGLTGAWRGVGCKL